MGKSASLESLINPNLPRLLVRISLINRRSLPSDRDLVLHD